MPCQSPLHFNIARDVMEHWAHRRPKATALWWTDETGRQEQKISFAQLRHEFVRASSFFHQLGIQPGERVLVILPHVPQWSVALLGSIRLGAVPIPGTPLLTPMEPHLDYQHENPDPLCRGSVDSARVRFEGRRAV